MATASLILGVIGSVAGIGALAWQVITWSRSGPVAKLSIGVNWFPTRIYVTAVNSGRGPVSIMKLRFGDLHLLRIDLGLALGAETFPFRLEPGLSVSWEIDMEAIIDQLRHQDSYLLPSVLDDLAKVMDRHGEPEYNLKVWAILGNGKTIQSVPIFRGRLKERRWQRPALPLDWPP